MWLVWMRQLWSTISLMVDGKTPLKKDVSLPSCKEEIDRLSPERVQLDRTTPMETP